ncbi:liprin-beta-1 isoform X4 [Bradysia coprophila]|uniref:liprin-beta-1 isoform X4 n=1 Tax=Bradysia coprophila TaxID=38358 RepID=UPI00187D8B5D|nr:liprin-beta-1 isoform X4 [Bradysia coprophila]
MRELPRTTLKMVQKNLIPDGNRKKPPISNVSPPKDIATRTARESVTSDLSSSRPNSTASEGGCSSDDENNDGTTECSESGHESSSDDFGGENRTALDPISEEASLAKRSEDDDESTCCDEDFTWVRSDPPIESRSLPTDHVINSPITNNSAKPPRPAGSLDRRRTSHTNRQERDNKSRSAHSLKERSVSSEFKDASNEKGHHHDSNHHHHSRASPGFWEPPPPPQIPYSHYDAPHYYNNYHGASREELRMIEYHRRQQHDMYRYGSNLTLSASQEIYNTGGCCNARYHALPPPPCCCDHRSFPWNGNQRQDTDERLRRLQTDKESMALQVQVLTEQVSAQSDKIADLERIILDKTQQLSQSEDLLQREMLSRSSLETQKLELMSAMSELKLLHASLERENLELRASNLNNNSIPPRRPPVPGRISGTTSLNSTPIHGSHNSLQNSTPIPLTPKTPPASYRRQVDLHYSSLPRQAYPSSVTVPTNSTSGSTPTVSGNQVVDSNANPKQRVAFAESEKIIEDTMDHHQRSFTPQPSPSPSMSQKNRGLRSIFGKIKRSNSGNLEDLPGDGEFRRGGIRATAGARLGWNNSLPKPDKPFAEWDIDAVCGWLDEMGLGCYEDEARKWLKKGAKDLVSASPVDIEKELNVKTPLHRKKINLAVIDITGADNDELFVNAGKLDPIWIMRWLDDVGLPQHKDVFSTARVDGRMLHRLTMDDLVNLHVTSSLHAASLRRGIQVMRENNWNPECLIRRSGTDDDQAKQVQLWTAHRVMEWLRLVDLAEYAPNLRGAGVHGALMMYEPRFTSELLADLLSIPPSKTLLRRHLGTHFKELLGRDVIQLKREAETTLGFQPLTLVAKIKTPKKSQFSLKRKKSTKGGDEWSDFVCPMGPSGEKTLQTTSNTNMTNQTVLEAVAASEVASQPNSSDSPTSSRSSTS